MGTPAPSPLCATFYWNVNQPGYYAATYGNVAGGGGFRSNDPACRPGIGWHSQFFQTGVQGNAYRKDGVDMTAQATNAQNNPTQPTIPPILPRVGSANSRNNGERLNGHLAFMCCWMDSTTQGIVGGLPSLDDLQKIEGWAHWDLGLQDLLPADHPYKAGPPMVPDVARAVVASAPEVAPEPKPKPKGRPRKTKKAK